MRIESLTFLRFVAALVVVFFHFGKEATGLTGFFVSGPQMVTFFFVLSGFVMAIAYGSKSKVSVGPFLWARTARILPVYLAALALVVLSYLVRGKEIGSVALGLNVTLLQSWFPPYPTSLNTPGWSLSVEMFFYATLPCLLAFFQGIRPRPVVLGGIVLALWMGTQVIHSSVLERAASESTEILHDLVYYFPPSHLCSFAMGLAGGLIFQDKGWYRSSGWGAFFVSFGAGALIVYGLDHPDRIEALLGVPLAFASSFYAPLFLVLILAVASSRWPWSDWLAWRPLVLLGEASYSLYILQLPIHQMYSKFLAGRLGLDALANFALYVLILIGVSIFSFLWFEKPTNRFLRSRPPLAWFRPQSVQG